MLDNYAVLQTLWEECLEEPLQSDIKARIIGVQAQMKLFHFFYVLSLCFLILKHTDNLSCASQGANVSASEGQVLASMTLETIQSLRSDDNCRQFWDYVCKNASNLK